MRRLGIALIFIALSGSALASRPVLFPLPNGGHLVVVASMRHLVRSDDPLSIEKGDLIEVSNGCGYDTAIVEVEKKLIGKYKFDILAAHLEVNEFCDSLLQPEVEHYLLVLNWNDKVWEIDQDLSSRLLPDEHGKLWLVEPALISQIAQAGGPRSEPVKFNRVLLEDIALGREARRGADSTLGLSRADHIAELEKLLPVDGDWPDNPLYFARGVSLSALESWLSAN